MFKKMMLLASMALAVLAVAGPASASASWLMEGNEITKNETMTVSGPAAFSTGAAGAEATIHATIELTAGTTTGHVTSFTATGCKGTGALAGLTCTTAAKELNWTCHIKPDNTIEITDINLHNVYYAGAHIPANAKATTSLVGDIKATPNNAEEISSLSLSNINATANGNAVSITGTLAASPAGTFGVEG